MSCKYIKQENVISPDEFLDKLKTIKQELCLLEPDSNYIRDDSGSVDSYTSVDEMQAFVEDVLTRKQDKNTKTYFNLGRLRENLYFALKELMSSKDVDSAYILEDEKFYLKKTKYRIEIRDHNQESKIWWAYVMYNDIPFETYANRLFAKYVTLIDKSNVNDFHGNVA